MVDKRVVSVLGGGGGAAEERLGDDGIDVSCCGFFITSSSKQTFRLSKTGESSANVTDFCTFAVEIDGLFELLYGGGDLYGGALMADFIVDEYIACGIVDVGFGVTARSHSSILGVANGLLLLLLMLL